MKRLRADYVHDELGGSDVYAHGLLKMAKALAPPGPSADEILLFQMERGFDDTGMCSAGAERILASDSARRVPARERAYPTDLQLLAIRRPRGLGCV